ncbi:hypothetical protein [Pseudomonas sp. NUPR-001]|uniref:hypothetical protein n=1 Tax=Pseudomonas sp. NUPR-001 TaxID=3416058 RepID=UPI003F9A0968
MNTLNELSPTWLSKTAFASSIGTLCPTKDNKILVFSDSDTEKSDVFIGRLLSDGTLDRSFQGTGFIKHVFPCVEGSLFFALSAHQQSDEKIFLVGTIVGPEALYPAAARFEDSGKADPSFGEGGFAVFADKSVARKAGAQTIADLRTLREQPSNAHNVNASRLADGGYLIASAEIGYLLGVTKDGTLNTAFGDNGYLRPKLENAEVIELQSAMVFGERIYVVGYVNASGVIACFTLDGKRDDTFGEQGARSIPIADANHVRLTNLSSAASLLNLIGFANTSTQRNGALLTRLTTEGALDTSFNTGKPVLLYPDGRQADCRHVASGQNQSPDKPIYIVGQTTLQDQGDPRFYAAAYQANGSLDNSFTPGGWGLGPGRSTALGMYLGSQNNMLLCGTARDANGTYEGFVASYTLNGS